jgi:phenylalanyl-tRNA synthetase alpha subunit
MWYTTQDGPNFTETWTAFSASFPSTYVPLNQASWEVGVDGLNTSGWVCTGCGLVGDKSLGSVGTQVQVWGPSYAAEHVMIYH